jgi:Fic family protein
MMYLWEKPDFPSLTWDDKSLTRLLAEVSREQGRLLGKMESLGLLIFGL